MEKGDPHETPKRMQRCALDNGIPASPRPLLQALMPAFTLIVPGDAKRVKNPRATSHWPDSSQALGGASVSTSPEANDVICRKAGHSKNVQSPLHSCCLSWCQPCATQPLFRTTTSPATEWPHIFGAFAPFGSRSKGAPSVSVAMRSMRSMRRRSASCRSRSWAAPG